MTTLLSPDTELAMLILGGAQVTYRPFDTPIEDRAAGILALAHGLQVNPQYEPDPAVMDLAKGVLDLAGEDLDPASRVSEAIQSWPVGAEVTAEAIAERAGLSLEATLDAMAEVAFCKCGARAEFYCCGRAKCERCYQVHEVVHE